MGENDDYRIDGTIEQVGFYQGMDPEALVELQATQKMYERIADETRSRKRIPFKKVMAKIKSKSEEEAKGSSPDETGDTAAGETGETSTEKNNRQRFR